MLSASGIGDAKAYPLIPAEAGTQAFSTTKSTKSTNGPSSTRRAAPNKAGPASLQSAPAAGRHFVLFVFFGVQPISRLMAPLVPYLLAVLGGYLLGSIPFGVIATRLAGLGDIRN